MPDREVMDIIFDYLDSLCTRRKWSYVAMYLKGVCATFHGYTDLEIITMLTIVKPAKKDIGIMYTKLYTLLENRLRMFHNPEAEDILKGLR